MLWRNIRAVGICQSLNDRGVHAFGAVVDKELKNVERQPFFDLWSVRRCRNGMAPLLSLTLTLTTTKKKKKKKSLTKSMWLAPVPFL